ncbi:cell division protein FtsQ/DivIB [Barnesiella sp. An55]|uniref:cell division protein FtsQ/DivIB n=1 Tax=Barnesiella sp. An55 TaxID=1965646 RepID=UPI000B365A8C|nr:cell division protein FtsQ/DivIB [Barnesiella sp. An55]OUN69737.1 hypothetical protein B5G10_11150 [Barnesiella sp. An55]HIZ25579.1 cell division protein FtsQ [Candidatus Barnesiella merdipullorum]
MKALLRFLFMVVLVAYLFVSFFILRSQAAEDKCIDLQVEVLDSTARHYISPADIYGYIEEYDLDPCGKPMGEIDTEKIERTLMLNGVLGSVECYKRAGGTLYVGVTQRVPVMRVMANGSNYYVDTEGQRMAAGGQYRAHLPLVTGQLDSVFTYRELLPIARYVYEHPFWNAQIEQIYVNERHEIELVPRVGDQTILLGSAQDYETKFDNLMLVYKKVFNETGWSMYDTVSLKFKDQVVCTRRKKW